jgi:hypothetical protein
MISSALKNTLISKLSMLVPNGRFVHSFLPERMSLVPQAPPDKVEETNADVLEIALEICQFFYSNDSATRTYVIDKWFERTATFDDPLVSIRGTKAIHNNMLIFSLFKQTTCDVKYVGYLHTPQAALNEDSFENERDRQVVTLQVEHRWTLPVVKYTLVWPITTVLVFNQDKRVLSYYDSWNLLHMIQLIPFLGWFYSLILRPLMGSTTDKLVTLIVK